MSRIALTIQAGPNTGQRLVFQQSPITFGRQSDRDIVIDLAAVSREHGEIRKQDEHWLVINQSPNGTKVGRKKVGSKGKFLNDGHAIYVGGLKLIHVDLLPVDSGGLEEPQDHVDEERNAEAAVATSSIMKGRGRVFMGIGIFWAFLLGLVIFLTMTSPGDNDDENLTRLTEQEIRAVVEAPLDRQSSDERRMNHSLGEAQRYFALSKTQPQALYEAYVHYRLAQSYAPEGKLADPIDQVRAREVSNQLADRVVELYETAIQNQRSGRYADAEKSWRELVDLFEDTESPIFENAQKHLRQARRHTR